MEYASFDDLLVGNATEQEDLKLPNSMVIQVKGLTRYEYTLALKVSSTSGEVNMSELEIGLVQYGMASPKLEKGQADRWLKEAPAGTISIVLDTIRRLSGLSDDAEKSDVS